MNFFKLGPAMFIVTALTATSELLLSSSRAAAQTFVV